MLDDPIADHAEVTRLVVCSGKLYYDIAGHELRRRRRTWPSPVSSSSIRFRSRPRRGSSRRTRA